MKRWGNLTKYSQQGWEALNALIKLFFFRQTSKGGYRSGNDVWDKSKLLPIADLIQRRMFWICNLFPSSVWEGQNDVAPQEENSSDNDNDLVHNIVDDTLTLV